MTKFCSSVPDSRACRTIWTASLLWLMPLPEKIGSFWPRMRVASPSIVEMPVLM